MSYSAYLDCYAGIDGETLLAALFDVGLSLDTLKQTLALLPLQNYDISIEHTAHKNLRGTCIMLNVTSPTSYTLSEVEILLSPASIPVYIRDTTLKVLRRLMDAEIVVHHEEISNQVYQIEAFDLLIILSIVIGLKELNISQLYSSMLPLPSGSTNISYSHNATTFPIALEILRSTNALWKPTSVENRHVTSTGAALLATLAHFDTPTMTIERVGYGVAEQSLATGNSLRLYLGTSQQELMQQEDGDADSDWVTVLSTNIDNMSGEIIGGLMDRLLTAGALDVSYTPMQMKKNRPAIMLMVVCPLEKGNELAHILLRETATLGVRVQQVQRLKAQRTQQQIDTQLGPVLIKVKYLGSRIISASPEYEECQRLSHEHNLPLVDVYAITQKEIANTLLVIDEKPDI